MKKLNIKKLKLNKSTVNSLSKDQTKSIVGGDNYSHYSPCENTPTWLCCTKKGSVILV